MKKLLALIITSTMLLTGCTTSTDTNANVPAQDPAGNSIIVPEGVEGIVSLAPSFTEVIIDLGRGDDLVAVDTYSALLEGVPTDVVSVDMTTPNMEELAVLEPDIVFASSLTTWEGTAMFEPLIGMGVCVVEVPTSDSIASIQDDILFIGSVLSCDKEANTMVSEMQDAIDRIATVGATIEEKKSVIFEIASAPDVYSTGSGTFVHEMITLVGATNAIEKQEGWISLSAEAEVSANPDVILTNVNYLEDAVGEILTREGYGQVKAIQDNAVYYIDTNTSSVPNHNIVIALQQIAEQIYPEYY